MYEPDQDSWLLSPSGSRALEDTWPEESTNYPTSFHNQPGEQVYYGVTSGQFYEAHEVDTLEQVLQNEEDQNYAAVAADSLASELLPGQLMSPPCLQWKGQLVCI